MLAGPVSMVTLLNGCQGLRPKTLTHSLLATGVEDEIGVPSGSLSFVGSCLAIVGSVLLGFFLVAARRQMRTKWLTQETTWEVKFVATK